MKFARWNFIAFLSPTFVKKIVSLQEDYFYSIQYYNIYVTIAKIDQKTNYHADMLLMNFFKAFKYWIFTKNKLFIGQKLCLKQIFLLKVIKKRAHELFVIDCWFVSSRDISHSASQYIILLYSYITIFILCKYIYFHNIKNYSLDLS